MANVPNVGPKYQISSSTNGNRLLLGNASAMDSEMGGIAIHLVNGADNGGTPFTGSVVIVGRLHNAATQLDNVGYQQLPFRSLYLNGAVSDGSLQIAGTPLTDTSIVVVPSMVFDIAVEVACASGTATLYKVAMEGTVFP